MVAAVALLSDLGEFRLLERIRARLPAPSGRVRIPIGDDASACDVPGPSDALVSTVDLLTEGVDFLPGTPGRSVGWKCIAVNLSDLAAMGATPSGVLVALAAPAGTEVEWVEALYDGIAAICSVHGVDVLGGDLSGVAADGGITLSVTALGHARRDRLVRREGARIGDLLCVTGTLGDAAAGLERLLSATPPAAGDPLVARQLEPTPRVAAGIALAVEGIATAMIDVSDGLIADLGHLLDASRVGARVEVASLPLSDALRASGIDAVRSALVGGEDFELLFAVRAEDEAHARAACARAATPFTVIGRVTDGPGTTLVRPDGTHLPPPARPGWSHFR